jgi:PAS domain S-box-containing protein
MDQPSHGPSLLAPDTSDTRLVIRYLLGLALALTAFFWAATLVDKKAVALHEKVFNIQQGQQTAIVKRAMEDHVSRLISDAGVLANHSLVEFARGERSLDSVNNLFLITLAAHTDVLVCAYFTAPGEPVASQSVQAPGASRAEAKAREWCASSWPVLAGGCPALLVPPIHAESQDKFAGLLLPVREDESLAGVLVIVCDLGPMIGRYLVQGAFGRSGRCFMLDGHGTVVHDSAPSRIGHNILAASEDGAPGMARVYRRMLAELEGQDDYVLDDKDASTSSRILVAWNTLYWGNHKIVIGQSAPDQEIDGILQNLRLQRNILFGYLVLVSLVMSFVFYRSRRKLYLKTTGALQNQVGERTALLAQSEARYRNILQSIEEGYFEVDMAGGFTFMNESARRTLGYPMEETLGKNNREYTSPETAKNALRVFQEVYTTRLPSRIPDYEVITRDGEVRILDVTASVIVNAEGEVTGFRGVSRDVTEQRRTELKLLESQQRLSLAIQAASLGLWDWNLKTGEVVFNDTWARMMELPPDRGGGTMDGYQGQVHQDDLTGLADAVLDHIEGRTDFFRHEHRVKTQTGAWKWVFVQGCVVGTDENGKPARMAGIHMDITPAKQAEKEKEELENRLIQARKMEAVGTLAGGIAHDFNNILSAIMACTEAAKLNGQDPAKVRAGLGEIEKACRRARDLARQILTFSRHAETETRPVRLDLVITEAMALLRATLPSTIETRVALPGEPVAVLGDSTRMHQVVMNLCSNAGHAMRQTGGVLEVRLDTLLAGPENTPPGPGLSPGDYAVLTVSDTGHGMDEKTLERIFNPYFTTKDVGEGTGLGLAMVHGIVTGAGGACAVQSKTGEGATFTVWLPRTAPAPETPEPELEQMPGGSERLLLVDDDPSLVDSFVQIIGHFGYRVTAAEDSGKALELFSKDPWAFDLVITDQTMPGMTGEELARAVLALRPETPVILCSGYSAAITENDALEKGIRAFVMKPFSFTDFMVLLRQVLDGKTTCGRANTVK